jgi:aconitase B
MISWGHQSGQTVAIGRAVPSDAGAAPLAYMEWRPVAPLAGLPIDAAFIGSCTNARLSDLRAAARLLEGRHIAPGVRALCVPGSSAVKRAAEAEGLDRIFEAAGFEWRESGCSMCFYAGGESFAPGSRVVSSTNRNFEGRQGPGIKTMSQAPRPSLPAPSRALSPTLASMPDDGFHSVTRFTAVARARCCATMSIPIRSSVARDAQHRQDRPGRRAVRGMALYRGARTEPEFVLNDARYGGARILLAGANFGSGSSREHAVWALAEYGIGAVIAVGFAPIFQGNCIRNGIVPAAIEGAAIEEIAAHVAADPQANRVTVDVLAGTVSLSDWSQLVLSAGGRGAGDAGGRARRDRPDRQHMATKSPRGRRAIAPRAPWIYLGEAA